MYSRMMSTGNITGGALHQVRVTVRSWVREMWIVTTRKFAMVNVITKSTILAMENVQLKSVRSQIRVRISVGNDPDEKVHDDGITTPDSTLSMTPQTTQPSLETNAGILEKKTRYFFLILSIFYLLEICWIRWKYFGASLYTQCIHCILGWWMIELCINVLFIFHILCFNDFPTDFL